MLTVLTKEIQQPLGGLFLACCMAPQHIIRPMMDMSDEAKEQEFSLELKRKIPIFIVGGTKDPIIT